ALDAVAEFLAPVLLLHDHVSQLSVAQDKLLQRSLLIGALRQDARLHAPATVSEDEGVDRVGLGELPAGSGELPDLAGIDLADRQSGRLQGRNDKALVTAGRLQDQPLDPL